MSFAGRRAAGLAAVMGLALALRVLRGAVRWHEDAWLYSVYPAEVFDLVRTLRWHRVPFAFTGLHPPAWPVLHSLTELLDPRPIWWIAESVLLSTGAVYLLARRSMWAALVLATTPVAVHYSAEVNQYALLTFGLAGLWACSPMSSSRVHWPVVAWGALVSWTHILGGIAAVVAAATLPRKHRWTTLAALGTAMAPLSVGVWRAMSVDSTFQQPSFELGLVVSDAVRRFGGLELILIAIAVVGARRSPRLGLGCVVSAGAVALFVGLRVAAPHQFPYLLTILVPIALLVAQVPRMKVLLMALSLVQATWQLQFDIWRAQALLVDLERGQRGVDLAMEALDTPWTCDSEQLAADCSGDALVLLRPPGRNDDDKTRISAVMWRIRPWWRMPRVALDAVPLASADHRYGQPRLVHMPSGSFVVYVHDHARATLSQPLLDHEQTFLVVSEVGPSSNLLRTARERTGLDGVAVGADWVFSASQ